MAAPLIFHKQDYREGRWRNGMGVSWDIASDPAAGADFGWRLATARIDGDVPFSSYPMVDRVFTLIEGDGLDLAVAGLGTIAVETCFVPQRFPGDAHTFCTLRGGPCRALNLFLARGRWTADVTVHRVGGAVALSHHGPTLLFALQGRVTIGAEDLNEGDAAHLASPATAASSSSALLYVAALSARRVI